MFQMIIFFYNVTDYKKYLQIYLTKTCKVDKSIKKNLDDEFLYAHIYVYGHICLCICTHIYIYTYLQSHTYIHTRVRRTCLRLR